MESFNDGDDAHIAAVGLVAEIQADLGIGSPSVNYEVSSDGRKNDEESVAGAENDQL